MEEEEAGKLRSAGECKGGQGIYKTLKNETKNAENKAFVDECFEGVKKKPKIKWGCYHHFAGRCNCTIDSNFIWNYDQTLMEGLYNLIKNTNGFENNEAETHEGNMYLSYRCGEKTTPPEALLFR